jgi:GAF domain-containing protein/anti-sigma regulatory factor (Ser/Thr protein kinase)
MRVTSEAIALHRRVIAIGAAMTAATLAVALVRYLLTDQIEPFRLFTLTSILLIGVRELRGEARLWLVSRVVAVMMSVLSLVDVIIPAHLGGAPPDVMVGMLVVFAAFDAALAAQSRRDGVPFVALVSGFYAAATVALEQPAIFESVGRMIVGVVGPFATWVLVAQMARSMRAATGHAERQAKVDAALARCSTLLLTDSSDSAIPDAIAALLEATDAGHVYVDANGVDERGVLNWTIIHAAQRRVLPGPGLLWTGTYEDIPDVLDSLQAGRPAMVVVADLPPSDLRTGYEREFVTGELCAPIFVSGSWVGTIGFTDYSDRREWTGPEVGMVVRSAEMIGAHLTQRRATEGLIDINEAKSRFLSAVSHELRTPLAAVMGFAAELADRPHLLEQGEAREIADLIRQQAGEIGDLVADLLAVERAAVGSLTSLPEPLRLRGEVDAVLRALNPPAGRVRVEGPDVVGVADSLHVRQVVRNLVSNALRHGGGRVEIRLSELGDMATVAVSDDGAGIDPLDVELMFDDFAQETVETTRPGTVGLGLAVARRLARLMGGDIVYTRSNGWTRFVLTLPLAWTTASVTSVGSGTHSEQPDEDAVHQRLPRGLDDVLVDADRAPRVLVSRRSRAGP